MASKAKNECLQETIYNPNNSNSHSYLPYVNEVGIVLEGIRYTIGLNEALNQMYMPGERKMSYFTLATFVERLTTSSKQN